MRDSILGKWQEDGEENEGNDDGEEPLAESEEEESGDGEDSYERGQPSSMESQHSQDG